MSQITPAKPPPSVAPAPSSAAKHPAPFFLGHEDPARVSHPVGSDLPLPPHVLGHAPHVLRSQFESTQSNGLGLSKTPVPTAAWEGSLRPASAPCTADVEEGSAAEPFAPSPSQQSQSLVERLATARAKAQGAAVERSRAPLRTADLPAAFASPALVAACPSIRPGRLGGIGGGATAITPGRAHAAPLKKQPRDPNRPLPPPQLLSATTTGTCATAGYHAQHLSKKAAASASEEAVGRESGVRSAKRAARAVVAHISRAGKASLKNPLSHAPIHARRDDGGGGGAAIVADCTASTVVASAGQQQQSEGARRAAAEENAMKVEVARATAAARVRAHKSAMALRRANGAASSDSTAAAAASGKTASEAAAGTTSGAFPTEAGNAQRMRAAAASRAKQAADESMAGAAAREHEAAEREATKRGKGAAARYATAALHAEAAKAEAEAAAEEGASTAATTAGRAAAERSVAATTPSQFPTAAAQAMRHRAAAATRAKAESDTRSMLLLLPLAALRRRHGSSSFAAGASSGSAGVDVSSTAITDDGDVTQRKPGWTPAHAKSRADRHARTVALSNSRAARDDDVAPAVPGCRLRCATLYAQHNR